MKKVIHVNQHVIRRNDKTGEREPCITCKTYKTNGYYTEITIDGPSRIVYRPDKPLKCGAKVWIETDAEVNGTVSDYPDPMYAHREEEE